MKKIINKPEDVVKECLMGLQMANSDTLEYIPEKEVIYRKKMDKKVAVISGGGAGHEPLHAGLWEKECLTPQFPEMYFPLRALIVLKQQLKKWSRGKESSL